MHSRLCFLFCFIVLAVGPSFGQQPVISSIDTAYSNTSKSQEGEKKTTPPAPLGNLASKGTPQTLAKQSLLAREENLKNTAVTYSDFSDNRSGQVRNLIIGGFAEFTTVLILVVLYKRKTRT